MSTRAWVIVALVELCVLVGLWIVWPDDATQVPVGGPEVRTAPDATEPAARTADPGSDALLAHDPANGIVVDPRRSVDAHPADADPEIGAVVVGRLTDASTGVLLEDGYLYFSADGTAPISRPTNDGGRYAALGLSPGRYVAHARCVGYLDAEREIVVDDRAVQRHDLELTPAVRLPVAFRTPDGESLRELGQRQGDSGLMMLLFGLTCVVTTDPPPERFPETELRAVRDVGHGRWQGPMSAGRDGIPNGYDGVLELSEPLPSWVAVVLRHVVVSKQRVLPGAEEVVFEIPEQVVLGVLGGVRLRVVAAEDGSPLEGARVSLSDVQSGAPGSPTDPEGRVRLESCAPGLGQLSIYAAERERLVRFVRIASGEVLDLGDVELAEPVALAGRVVDAQGEPVAGASVSAFRPDRLLEGAPRSNTHRAETDSEGRFEFAGLGRGPHVLKVYDQAGGKARLVVDTTGDPPRQSVELRTAPPVEVGFESRLEGADRVVVTLTESGGTVVASFPISAGRADPVRVLPGRYVARIYRGPELLRQSTLDVVHGAEPTLRVP